MDAVFYGGPFDGDRCLMRYPRVTPEFRRLGQTDVVSSQESWADLLRHGLNSTPVHRYLYAGWHDEREAWYYYVGTR